MCVCAHVCGTCYNAQVHSQSALIKAQIYGCPSVCVCLRVRAPQGNPFYTTWLTQDSRERTREKKRSEKKRRHCWHKMLTCQHWLRGDWETETWEEETVDQIGEGKKWTEHNVKRMWLKLERHRMERNIWGWQRKWSGDGRRDGTVWCKLRSFTWPLCNSPAGTSSPSQSIPHSQFPSPIPSFICKRTHA